MLFLALVLQRILLQTIIYLAIVKSHSSSCLALGQTVACWYYQTNYAYKS